MFKKTSWARLQNTLSPTIALLLLVWISPTAAEPTSYNDPFRAITLRAPKTPDPPICCFKPLPPLEPVEDVLPLLSFDEWKAKQDNSENVSSAHSPSNGSNGTRDEMGNISDPENVEDTSSPPAAPEEHRPHVPENSQELPLQISPHFRVPLVDRFNYASLDCSARVHKAHKGAKHSSNILSSKKDRYLLGPCKTNGEKQFVVIELCEDIRIDTVQLANFEFFSGVFKEFTVSVAKTTWKDDSEEGWTVAGTYKAKNVRGVQSFHPPTSLRGFYRYLRIDFHSHYGSEYYCPVSLVRVYGLTHLEEWKWELWEAESRAKMEATLKDAQMHRTTATLDSSNLTDETPQVEDPDKSINEGKVIPSTPPSPINETGNDARPAVTMAAELPSHSTDTFLSSPSIITQPPEHETFSPYSVVESTSVPVASSLTPVLSLPHHSTEPVNNVTPPSFPPHNDSTTPTPSIVGPATSGRTSSSSIVVRASPLTTAHPFLPMPISGGESIYRMIMNRLVGVERNHTLYEQYMAQQQLVVREALKRLGEDVGRLQGLEKTQRQAHDRLVLEWEKRRKQWQMEHAQLLQRIDYLSDEIIMEKRLGVAQLCLLLAVLVFMGLTRGSRGSVFEDRRHWRGTLKSISGDWSRPRLKASEDLQVPRDIRHIEFSKSVPVRPIPQAATDSGSGLLSGSVDMVAPAPARLPLANLDTNVSGHQQQPIFSSDENPRPEHTRNVPIVWDNPGTPTRVRSRTTSRSHSRASSWQGKGLLFHSGAPISRPSWESRVPHVSNNGVSGTPSKGLRMAGVHTSRPAFISIRSSGYTSNSRRVTPLQRSHSSYGYSGSLDYILGETWTGSGIAPKSAREWARTAHLHEVKGKRREEEAKPEIGENANGISETIGDRSAIDLVGYDEDDIFGGAELSRKKDGELENQRAKLLLIGNEEADADPDGWESASDVGVDSIEGFF